MTPLPSQAAALLDQTTCWTADVDALRPAAAARSWLTEPGLLTERVRGRCPAAFGLRIVDQRHDLLDAADAQALEVTDLSAFFREIELACGGTALVFAQTLVPDATLAAEPWLALLGNDALGPRLASMGGALREPLEFARLSPGEALFERAVRDAAAAPHELWARRARYRLATHRLIVQEVFLPEALA